MSVLSDQPAEASGERLYRRLSGKDAVSVILKLRGETCDIDCLYCYEKRKEAPGGARIGVEHVHRLTEVFRGRPLAVELHGGEPLSIGKDAMAALLTELAAQPTVVRVSMQTNGVRLDDEWLDLFDATYPKLRIGVSLDGDAQGNAWRVGYDGKPVYPKVTQALRLLGQRGRRTGVIAAVTPKLLQRAEEVLEHLAGFDAVNAISFVPCFDAAVTRSTSSVGRRSQSRTLQQAAVTEDGPAWAITPGSYTDFVLAAGVHWVTSGLYKRIKLEPVVSTLRRLRGLDTGFCHFSDLKCDHVFTVYPDNRLGGCDELPWPAARLGTLGELRDVPSAQEQSPLLSRGRSLMTKCATCAYRATCGGGCVATRLRYVADEHAYCQSRMRLVDGAAALLTQPHAPAGVWCANLRWRPRDPNQMRDVAGFLARWDAPPAEPVPVGIRASAFGNLNTVGLPGVHEAEDLDPAHPQWGQAIEPGVRRLVDACTSGLGVITYDSCQGHDYPGTGIPPTGRRVGILPRDEREYPLIAAALCRAISSVQLPATVTASAGRAQLDCQTTGTRTAVLDLHLDPAGGWDTYFQDVDQATETLAAALRAQALNQCAACSCGRPS